MYKRKSFSVEVAEIADELNIPKATVERVLRTRLAHQVEALKRGESVSEEGLFTIKVCYDAHNDKFILRGSVSSALKSMLDSDGDKQLRLLTKIG